MLARPASIDFETLFASSPNPYVLLAPDLTIVTMNQAYLDATMRERHEIVGRKMFDAFPSDPASEATSCSRDRSTAYFAPARGMSSP